MARSTFHHVHVHSDYSILDGTGFVDEYVQLAVERGNGYVCVSDHGMASAYPSLMDSCEKAGVRPVYGVELYLNDYNMLVPEYSKLSDDMKAKVRQADHMLVFAENETGFSNILKLISRGWEQGFYYRPRVSWDELAEHSDGLVATTGCLASPINRIIAKDEPAKAKEMLKRWNDVFQDRLWVEWQMIDVEQQDINNPKLLNLAEDMGLPPLITNDVHYAAPEDAYLQRNQLLIQSKGGTVYNPKGLQFDSDVHWYTSEQEMDERWGRKYRRLMDNRDDLYERSKRETLALCQRCGYVNPDRSPKLPIIEQADDHLFLLCVDSMKKRGLYKLRAYRDRLEEELTLISKKGFSSYFLIQRDMIMGVRRDMHAEIGPGRGSVGGCLIAFLLGITFIDPVKYGLLFSRFLSPSRGGTQMSLHV